MPYFNGATHGFNHFQNGYVPPKPMTKIYCDECAETCIPLSPKTGDKTKDAKRRWANWGFNKPCDNCKAKL